MISVLNIADVWVQHIASHLLIRIILLTTPTTTAGSVRAVAAHYILHLLQQLQTEYVCVSMRRSGISNGSGLD